MAETSFKKPSIGGLDQDKKLLIASGTIALVAIVTLVIMLMSSSGTPEEAADSGPAVSAPAKGGADAGDE